MKPTPWIMTALLGAACSPAPITSTPLPEREAHDGPRFARIEAGTSGLEFTNELRPENTVAYLYSGAGVTVGDYDGDGLPDVYLVSQDGPNKLFRQVAPLRFEDVTESAGGLGGGEAWGSAASFADVDGDGDLDLYVCNTEAPNLLYRNLGDGTFEHATDHEGLAVTAASTGAAFADYDNDGDLDLYLLTYRMLSPLLSPLLVDEVELPADTRRTLEELYPYPGSDDGGRHEEFFFQMNGRLCVSGQRDRLLRNDGDGRWTDVSEYAGITGHDTGLSATWWDCDGDGWLDLYVANDLKTPDRLYRNAGDGTFEEITGDAVPHTAYFGMGSDFGDIDNDGRLDFCVADMSSTSHYMSKLLMGEMDQQRWFLMSAEPRQYMRNAVYVNTGTRRFLEAARITGLASSDWTWAVRFADLDGDGRLDFFATNGIPVFEDHPDKVAELSRLMRSEDPADREAFVAGFRALPRVEERNIARRNAGDLHFEDVGAEWGLDEASVGQGAVVTDLDRDGDLDVLVNNLNQPASLFENRSSGEHRILVRLEGTESHPHGVGSRVTLDVGGEAQTRLVSLARGYMSAGDAVVHFGLGQHDRIDRLRVRWPSGIEQEFTDLEADRTYTIREAGEVVPPREEAAPPTWFADVVTTLPRHEEREFDDYALQPLLPHRLSRLGPGLAWSDVDGDGRDDVWVGGAAGRSGSLLLAREDGFEPVPGPWREDAACEDMGAVFCDHDGDGDPDLYVVSGGIEAIEDPGAWQDRLYVNVGQGRFMKASGVLPGIETSGSSVCAADFDRDGDPDLFVGGRVIAGRFPEAPPSVLLRNEGGRFVDATESLAPALVGAGMVTGAVWTDWDGDGWQDLVVAAQWQPVRVLRNDAGGGFEDVTGELGLDGMRGLWNGVAAGDLDRDGDMDLVATNLGLNTKYHADPEHELGIYAADFDADGELDVVESKRKDELLPVRGRSCSSQAMPFIAERFPTYEDFAKADLAAIYGQEQLDRSFKLSANELRSVVLENREGTFAIHPLPRRAQVAPGFGIGIADFDGDGHEDIALAQNFFSPEPETGRFDGGLGIVLAGRGKMRFEPVRAHRSGIVMPEDAMGLAVVDLDGDATPDFVCTTNDGPVRAFASRSEAPSLVVRLRGKAGNPSAYGARVTLEGPDGGRRVREIRGGAGYLSQSSPAAFFSGVAEGSRIAVRWPDGDTTTHDLGRTGGTVTLER